MTGNFQDHYGRGDNVGYNKTENHYYYSNSDSEYLEIESVLSNHLLNMDKSDFFYLKDPDLKINNLLTYYLGIFYVLQGGNCLPITLKHNLDDLNCLNTLKQLDLIIYNDNTIRMSKKGNYFYNYLIKKISFTI